MAINNKPAPDEERKNEKKNTLKENIFMTQLIKNERNMMCRFGKMMKYHDDIIPSNWLHLTFMPGSAYTLN